MNDRRYQAFAWDLFHLSPGERWLAESRAWRESAASLLDGMVTGTTPVDWPRAKAAGFMLVHSIELFLKAALIQKGQAARSHNLEKLLKAYGNAFPGNDFELHLDSFVAANRKIPFESFLKYPEVIDDVGTKWDASIHIDVRTWQAWAVTFSASVERIWPLIVAKYPYKPTKA